MKLLVVLCALAGYVAAEAGYHYNRPQSSYGVPSLSYSSGSSGNGYNQGAGYQQQSAQQVVQSVPSVSYNYQAVSSAPSGYQSGSGYQTGNTGYQGASSGGYQGASSGGYQGASSGGYQGASSGGYQGVSNGGYQGVSNGFQSAGNGIRTSSIVSSAPQASYQVSGSSQGNYASNYQSYGQSAAVIQQQAPAQVFKHFYVHAAPEEPQTAQFRQPLVLPAPQKHYKVIFIKAPTVAASSPQFIPVPTQNEEKTLVYVLSNKAEQAQNVVVPKFQAKPPSKPEVFFIKYNNKEDSHSVINNIVNDFNAKQPGQVSFSGLDNAESSGAVVSSNSGFGGSSSGFGGSNSGFGGSSFGSSSGSGSEFGGSSSQGVVNVASVADSGSYNGGSGSAGLESNSVTYSGSSEGSESQGSFASGNYNGGQSASVNSFASQSVPHATYGIQSFRSQ